MTQDFEALVNRRPELAEWVRQHKDGLSEAVGMRAPDEVWITLLANMARYANSSHPMFKDDWGRARCEVLRQFMSGEAVDQESLAMAVAHLMQSYSGACDRIWALEQSVQRRPMPRHRLGVERA